VINVMHLNAEHQGRELLNLLELLDRCLRIPDCGTETRATWERDTLRARRDLELLYTRGLGRDFVSGAVSPGAGSDRPKSERQESD